MKTCVKCNTSKELNQYYKSTRNLDGLEGRCKACKSAYRKSQYKKNRDIELSKNAAWKEANLERYKEIGREHYRNNKEEHNAFMQQHYYDNKGMYRAKDAKYRATKLKATPPWLTEKQLHDITVIYTACTKVSKRTGKPHHVDHVIPLQGENICGLHVPWNLAIIPAKMNLSKSNTY
jgi:hypothetical protein